MPLTGKACWTSCKRAVIFGDERKYFMGAFLYTANQYTGRYDTLIESEAANGGTDQKSGEN